MTSTTFVIAPGRVPVSAGRGNTDRQLISQDIAAGRVWLGTTSGVSASNGIPLDAGTSIPWTDQAELWIAADPANTGNTTIIVSDDSITDWNPSPAALAALTAARLAVTGIPNVLVQTTIADNDLIPAGGSKIYYIGSYASVIVYQGAGTSSALSWVQTYDATYPLAGLPLDADFFDLNLRHTLRVVGSYLYINNTSGANAGVTIIGSNRPADNRDDSRFSASGGDNWFATGHTYAVGDVFILTQGTLNITHIEGAAFAQFQINGPNLKGRFELVYRAGGLLSLILCDSNEMALASANDVQYATKQIALPGGVYSVRFRASAAATATVSVSMIPASFI